MNIDNTPTAAASNDACANGAPLWWSPTIASMIVVPTAEPMVDTMLSTPVAMPTSDSWTALVTDAAFDGRP